MIVDKRTHVGYKLKGEQTHVNPHFQYIEGANIPVPALSSKKTTAG